ncbi:MAG: hypothetical protein LBS09_02210 [Bacteroidales bacterium]|jgi:3-oxoacyl-[acyl-carrier-protein] synthase-1|nr:hypothetical protein [Bacteroidales bacterium]
MRLFIRKYGRIDEHSASVNGVTLPVTNAKKDTKFLTALYRSLDVDYPKFFKMDNLSKLGFLASELIFSNMTPRFIPREDVAVLCFNRSSSLETDTAYQATIEQDGYFPSPAVFVYTLPNIVTGEIAIREKFFGETSFYICEDFDAAQICRTVTEAFQDSDTRTVLAAWAESFGNRHEVRMMLISSDNDGIPFSEENVRKLLG